MQHYIMHDSAEWKLERWGKGLSYCLTNKEDDRSYFCQDDEANDFEAELGTLQDNDDGYTYDEICADLWDLYELAAS